MEKISIVKDLTSQMLIKMGFNFSEITVEEKENNITYVNIEPEEVSLLIGSQGKNLESMQHLLKVMLHSKFPDENIFLVLDIEYFKKKKQDNIIQNAKEKVELVRENHIAQILPPMNSFIRRLIHLEFSMPKYENIETESIGEGEERRVKILYKE